MSRWPRYPVIYEINTWVWIDELSSKYRTPVDLATVPHEEWDAIAAHGFDAVWFMGVWERSPAGIAISMQNRGLLEDFRRALPDFSAADNVGSPYCVRRYVVDGHLGGPKGLAVARQMLRDRGLRLVLDFVPNHVAPDHPWVAERPELLVRGSEDDLAADPTTFVRIGDEVLTPPLDGTILPGMTRLSVLQLLRDWGVPVRERPILVPELRAAAAAGTLHEVFGAGTAAVISPVGALGTAAGEITIGDGQPGEVARRLLAAITAIQYGEAEDPYGWTTEL
jgi:hypothetical protein